MSIKGDLITLQGAVNESLGILRAAYRPEATRGELAEAVGQALDALEAEDDEDAAEEDEDESDDEPS